jgi:acyl-CoA synthetase (AMP-forming)/AMP-acid ligase II
MLEEADGRVLAIADTSRRGLTYAELRESVGRAHRLLSPRGLGTDDTIAVAVPNGPAAAALLSALLTYCRVAPLNPASTQDEFAFALRDLGATALLTTRDLPAAGAAADARGVEQIMVAVHNGPRHAEFEFLSTETTTRAAARPRTPMPDDVAVLLHTSGTTARSKLVPLTQRNLVLSARGTAESLQLTPADTCLSMMPLFHVHGLVGGLLASFAAGASVCCTSGFKATAVSAALELSQATWYTAVPAMHRAIVGRARQHTEATRRHRLRLIRSCSATLDACVWERLQSVFGVPVLNAYGMTEAGHQISSVRLPASSCATVGTSSGADIAIMDPAGRLLPSGEVGEIVIRGAQVMSGYIQPAGANAGAFCDGWFRTGDQGLQRSDGSLELTGRLKEMINCAGEKISPYEVEETLLRHPAVDEVVAFAWPDAMLGEAVAVAVVVRDGWQFDEHGLLRLARDTLAKHKLPRRIFFVRDIPRSATGKVQRVGLAERFRQG